MIQRRHGARFALEAVREAFLRNLDGDLTVEARITGSVYFPHSSRAEGLEDFVRAEFLAGGERHRSDST
jgi:hypothetical protein